MSPEMELLIRCSGFNFSTSNMSRIRELQHAKINWHLLLWFARWHRVELQLYHCFKQNEDGLIPETIMNSLQHVTHAHTHNNLFMQRELLNLLKLLKSHQVTAVPVKGPLMASILSKDKFYYQSGSIHLILLRQNVPVVKDILGNEGYIKIGRSTFSHSGKRTVVKIHSSLTNSIVTSKNESFRNRLVTFKIGPDEYVSLSPVDHLLFLCISGARKHWARIGLVSELSGFVQSNKELNWPLLLKEARVLQAKRILLSGLQLGSQLMGLSIPSLIYKESAEDKAIKKITRLSVKLLANTGKRAVNNVEFLYYQTSLRKGIKDKLIYSRNFLRKLRFQNKMRRPHLLYGPRGLAEFVPTSPEIVERMLELAEAGPQDRLYDLGSGDGIIVITAAKKIGLRSVGIEMNPALIEKAKVKAEAEGVSHLVSFVEQDVLTADFSSATIITSYLRSFGNKKLLPHFRKQLKPGIRIITCDFSIPGLLPEKCVIVENGVRYVTYLYLWTL
ncbi:MAG: methyltransferase domain-containing protein [Candidatus Scalindua sp.]|nr:methyltransferase domain-containing protein [Candidatus Scalindua sp.]MBT6053113.1 methyltransferase domain-containing protein [Candidatus Scalindua sp.]MBT6230014.1 methyltransferase domain-containing protein [Candidatus Scalindua sp.]MBT7210062.1 methyltransferase domain-containing protein [Candidatus Scalindua sp.]MBT7591608.1 methyltransferase domain-containing protein [Candidatus Scalindua sp.]